MIILKANRKNLKEIVRITVKLLKQGKIIICPTDTVYIPVADATNKKAVKKVFLMKKRSLKKPIPIFVKDIKMVKTIAEIDKKQEQFLKSVWPGKVTAVLKRLQPSHRPKGIKLYGVAEDTIALRIPNFKLVSFLLKELNRPLVGTSANISGKPASGNLKEVLDQFKGQKHQPDLVINAGILPGKPSKVMDLTVSPPKILRL